MTGLIKIPAKLHMKRQKKNIILRIAVIALGVYLLYTLIATQAKIAANYVVESIKATLDDKDHWYGVKFEKAIPYLVKQIFSV